MCCSINRNSFWGFIFDYLSLNRENGSPWRSLCFRNLLYWWCGHDHLNCRFLYGIWYIYSCLHPFLLFLVMCSFCKHFDSYTIRVWYSSRFFPPWGQECFWMAFYKEITILSLFNFETKSEEIENSFWWHKKILYW